MTTALRNDTGRAREAQAWRRVAGGLILAVMLLGTILGLWAASSRTVSYTVNDKERVCSRHADGSECKYLIYTTAGVFEDTDSLLSLKWNSSDLYNKLQPGHRYTSNVIGWRIPFFSQYPNITSVEEN